MPPTASTTTSLPTFKRVPAHRLIHRLLSLFVTHMSQKPIRFAPAALRPGATLRRAQNAAAEESSEARDKQNAKEIEVGRPSRAGCSYL